MYFTTTLLFMVSCMFLVQETVSKDLHIGIMLPLEWETSIASAVAAIEEINDRDDILKDFTLKYHHIETKASTIPISSNSLSVIPVSLLHFFRMGSFSLITIGP